jgi:hypothetical protein
MSVSHCIDNHVPRILDWAENYDVAGLIAPRFLFLRAAPKTQFFPVHETIESFRHVKRVYQVYGVPERAQQEIFEGDHEFHGKQGSPFF